MIQNVEMSLYKDNQELPMFPGGYPDGMPMVDWANFKQYDEMALRPSCLNSFTTAMFLVDAIKERGGHIKRLILPSIPGARQDRLNPSGDYLFTLKSVAKMINERGFDEVVTVDPHSNVGPALIDRCCVYPLDVWARSLWNNHEGRFHSPGYSAVIAPDVGAAHRAETFASVLGVPYLQAHKVRDVSTGKLSGFTAPKEAMLDRKYLIVDDICDGGGTFLGLRDVLPEYARVDLLVTHGIFSQGTEKLLEKFNNVFTSDSTVFKSPGVLKCPIIERLRSF